MSSVYLGYNFCEALGSADWEYIDNLPPGPKLQNLDFKGLQSRLFLHQCILSNIYFITIFKILSKHMPKLSEHKEEINKNWKFAVDRAFKSNKSTA